MDMGCDEEAVAINFLRVVGVEGVEVVSKEFWNDPVWVWVGWWNEGADKLRIILKLGLGKMANGERGERRSGEVICDRSCGVVASILAASGGRETRR